MRTFEIRHKGLCATVQGVDDHLAVGRARDLDPPVLQARGGRGAVPRGLSTDMSRLGGKVEGNARVVATLGVFAGNEERVPG